MISKSLVLVAALSIAACRPGDDITDIPPVDDAPVAVIPDAPPAVDAPAENHAPVAADDSFAVSAGGLDVPEAALLANDSDPDGDSLHVTDVGSATHGVVSVARGEVWFMPDVGFTGVATFVYTVSDGRAATKATVTLAVAAEARPPVAGADHFPASEDTTLVISGNDLVANDTDPDGHTLFVTAVTATDVGRATFDDTLVTFTPPADFTGEAHFDYTVSNGLASAVGHVTVEVISVDDAPTAYATVITTDEDTPVRIELTGADPEGDPLTFYVVDAPRTGSLSAVTPTGPTRATVTYDPAHDANGDDTFAFVVSDGTLASAPVRVSIHVTPVNDAPLGVASAVTVGEDTPTVITLSGLDVDGDALTFTIAAPPAHGTLGEVTVTGATTAEVRYTPDPDANGSDDFAFVVHDEKRASEPVHVQIALAPASDRPRVQDASVVTAEDDAVDIVLAGSDADGDPLAFAISTPPASGSLGAIVATGDHTATVRYTPAADATGEVTFTYVANDGRDDSEPATVRIRVVPVNDAPVARSMAVTTAEDTSVTITFDGSDVDSTVLEAALVSHPTFGTLGPVTRVSDHSFSVTYTPAPNGHADDQFAFTVSDGTAVSAAATVIIHITPVNDPPTALAGETTTPEDADVTLLLLGADADGDALTAAVVTPPAHGVLGPITRVNASAFRVVYSPIANYHGDDAIAFTMSDASSTSSRAVMTVHVSSVNDTPVAAATSTSLDENTSTDITLTGTDVDGDILSFIITTPPAHGTLTAPARTSSTSAVVHYTPASGYAGSDAFAYAVTDETADSSPVSVAIEVTFVNAAPTATAATVTTDEDAATTVTFAGTDPDDDTLSVVIEEGPAHGTLGSLTRQSPTSFTAVYTPAHGYAGGDLVTFHTSDGALSSAAATITISVTAAAATAFCGDDHVDDGEQCDDGNADDKDGCTTKCKTGVVCNESNPRVDDARFYSTDPDSGECYISYDNVASDTSWSHAETVCEAAGGYLAVITSAAEQAVAATAFVDDGDNGWIGASRGSTAWSWVTGEAFSYTNWYPGEPSDSAGFDCAMLQKDGVDNAWSAAPCWVSPPSYLCEVPLVPWMPASSCGNGAMDSGETCDDSNTTSGDGCSASCQKETLFFSEYVEGSSNNKALEIYNPFSTSQDVAGCSIKLYANGATTSAFSYPLSNLVPATILAPHDVLVLCNASSGAALSPHCDGLVPASGATSAVNYNGDDAVELVCGGVVLDAIGQVGFQPAPTPNGEWGTGLTSTRDNTLRRKCSVSSGDANHSDVFDPMTEWGGFAIDTFDDLGTYTCVP